MKGLELAEQLYNEKVRDAIAAEDYAALEALLREGRLAKERIDAANPDQPSD